MQPMKFPTSLEIIRDLYRVMGIKIEHQKGIADQKVGLAKILDDKAFNLDAPHYDEDYAIDHLVPKGFSERTRNQFVTLLKNRFFKDYKQLLRSLRFTPVLNQDEVKTLLWQNYLIPRLNQLITFCIAELGIQTNWQGENFLQDSIQYLKENSVEFKSKFANLTLEDKNYIRRFGDRDALPTAPTLKKYFPPTNHELAKNFEILSFARLLQALKIEYDISSKPENIIKLIASLHTKAMTGKTMSQHDVQAMNSRAMAIAKSMNHYPFCSEVFMSYQPIDQRFFEQTSVKEDIFIQIPKSKPIRDKAAMMLEQIETYINARSELKHYLPYIQWNKANFLVYEYQFESALELYQKAIDGLIYTDMRYITELLSETLLISCIEPKQNKLISKIANIAIKFDLKLSVIDALSLRPSRFAKAYVFEDWERAATLNSFYQYFSKKTFIDEGKNMAQFISDYKFGGTLIHNPNIEPDFNQPNIKIFIDMENRRKSPQLLYFIRHGDFKAVQQLMEKGADINAITDTAETALLFAIERLIRDPIEGQKIFDLITQQQISKDNINLATRKRKHTAMFNAIEAIRPDIVKKLLELGANPNQTGLYGKTALYLCIELLNKMRDGVTYGDIINNRDNKSPYLQDSLKRFSNGSLDAGYIEQIQSLPDTDRQKQIWNELSGIEICPDNNMDEIYTIIDMLLNAGANPNNPSCEHPIKGYTAFMLAIESDLVEAARLMLQHQASLTQTYIEPRDGRTISILDIATHFKSSQCIALIHALGKD